MIHMRKAGMADLDFMVEVDRMDEGVTQTPELLEQFEDERQHREKISRFVTDPDKGAFVYEDSTADARVALIMFAMANRDVAYPWPTVFHEIDRGLFQQDGRFMEVFLLWVHPQYRRRGLGTKLKEKLEDEARLRGTNVIYTHTEETNSHVLELNRKLGYREVRRGPIWDSVVRVSLIKKL